MKLFFGLHTWISRQKLLKRGQALSSGVMAELVRENAGTGVLCRHDEPTLPTASRQEKQLQVFDSTWKVLNGEKDWEEYSLQFASLIACSAEAKEGFETAVRQYIFQNQDRKSRAHVSAAKWFEGEHARLSREMPTLVKGILTHPDRTARIPRLLTVLSLLRTMYLYDGESPDPQPLSAIDYARVSGIEFRLGEVFIVPFSESFRRHVFYTEDGRGGIYALEVKIPGNYVGRSCIHSDYFDLSRRLWLAAPEDPGVLKPLFFLSFPVTLRLYGKEREFSGEEPLGIAAFEHHLNSKRLSGTPTGLDKRVLDDILPPVIRAHSMGYLFGKYWEEDNLDFYSGSELHPGNVILDADGRAFLAADFGVISDHTSPESRKRETLGLIQRLCPPEGRKGLSEAICRRIMERAVSRTRNPRVQRQVAECAAYELDVQSST